ncbi:flagellar biosynthesis protein FlhB [Bacillus marinisedimentorum]|uniref:flagellar biosynthesis protein FlhB n=1 Tax=Bacillus marinisedimentorum TaxID=1821260 RepID=UPI0007DF1FA2|nr:flagellar biosynthesis protein FlhB [Bacillus marinisedimentorum]
MRLKLDLQFFSQEKTEKATPKKRMDSRKKGQVAKSSDVNTAMILLFVFLFLWAGGGYMEDRFFALFTHSFQESMLEDLTLANVPALFNEAAIDAAIIVAPVMAVAAAGAVFANYIQIGFLFSTEAIHFKLNKLDPIQGFKRIYSVRALVEMLKSILKISLVGFLTFGVIWLNFGEIIKLSSIDRASALAFLGGLTVQMGLYASLLLLFLAGLDYLYQRYDFEKNIRMSKQDVKDEYKKSEGDPLIKSKIKEKQRQMAMQRMMQEVPKADVVITNPTHFAIALKYDEERSDAPYVVAKGVDYVALKIKEAASKHEVATVEDRPLARALYAEVEIGDEIPEAFFKAIAEILAYVYRVEKKL